MKSINIFLVAMIAGFSSANAQQVFTNTSIAQVENHHVVAFTVPAEANVLQYRIEAGNDSNAMEVVSVVKAKGNSVAARSYKQDLFDASYKYYRIGVVGMGSQRHYSQILATQTQQVVPGHKTQEQRVDGGASLAQIHP